METKTREYLDKHYKFKPSGEKFIGRQDYYLEDSKRQNHLLKAVCGNSRKMYKNQIGCKFVYPEEEKNTFSCDNTNSDNCINDPGETPFIPDSKAAWYRSGLSSLFTKSVRKIGGRKRTRKNKKLRKR
jgi:hypothetical protein